MLALRSGWPRWSLRNNKVTSQIASCGAHTMAALPMSVYISCPWRDATSLPSVASPFVEAGFSYYPWDSEAHRGLPPLGQYRAIGRFLVGARAYVLVIPPDGAADMSASRMQMMSALETYDLPVIVVDPLDGERTAATHAAALSRSHTAVSNYITRAFSAMNRFFIVRTAAQAIELLARGVFKQDP